MFCTPTGEAAVATGKWNVVNNGRSQAVVLTMPKEVTPAEYGIEEHESGVSKMLSLPRAKATRFSVRANSSPKEQRLKAVASSSTQQLLSYS